ncbi:MAG: hypothetical protein ABJ013_08625 [Halioglobus sp.]
MSNRTWLWIAFGILLGLVAVIQFIPDDSDGNAVNPAASSTPE